MPVVRGRPMTDVSNPCMADLIIAAVFLDGAAMLDPYVRIGDMHVSRMQSSVDILSGRLPIPPMIAARHAFRNLLHRSFTCGRHAIFFRRRSIRMITPNVVIWSFALLVNGLKNRKVVLCKPSIKVMFE